MFQNYQSLIIAFQCNDNLPLLYAILRLFSIVLMLILYLKTLISMCYQFDYRSPSFINKKQSPIAFLATNVRAIYLALVDNSAIVSCFFEHQLTGPLFSIKIKSFVDFWLSLSSAQFKFKYSLIRSQFQLPYVIS